MSASRTCRISPARSVQSLARRRGNIATPRSRAVTPGRREAASPGSINTSLNWFTPTEHTRWFRGYGFRAPRFARPRNDNGAIFSKFWSIASPIRLRTNDGDLTMLNHVSIGVRDIARTKRFYDAALKPLGYRSEERRVG